MKLLLFWVGVLSASCLARADTLPVITTQPTNQTVSPGGTAKFSVAATGATAFQWRFNGTDIPNETNALLQISNVQTNNAGYYLVTVKNSTGWVPSALAYLATGLPIFDDNEGTVPFSNVGIPSSQAQYQGPFGFGPITNGMATVEVGPQLDEMQTVPFYTASVSNGYFNGIAASAPPVMPGQTVYYRVDITYTINGFTWKQQSTVLKLIATKWPALPDASNLKFPGWPEWPEPYLAYGPPVNITKIPGETLNLTNQFFAYTDFGNPTCQWRKDGKNIPGATTLVQVSGGGWGGSYQTILSVTNLQAADTGVYDLIVFGNNWSVSPKISLAVQTLNGAGILQSPRFSDTNFLCDVMGIVGRQYALQWSTNLADWQTLSTASNSIGTITFTNFPAAGQGFYRSQLLP